MVDGVLWGEKKVVFAYRVFGLLQQWMVGRDTGCEDLQIALVRVKHSRREDGIAIFIGAGFGGTVIIKSLAAPQISGDGAGSKAVAE